jgi:hypothetical protein
MVVVCVGVRGEFPFGKKIFLLARLPASIFTQEGENLPANQITLKISALPAIRKKQTLAARFEYH